MTQQLVAPPTSTPLSIAAEVERACAGLSDADPRRVGAAADLAEAVRQAASLVVTDPVYSTVAARLPARSIAEETGPVTFAAAYGQGLLNGETAGFVARNAAALEALVDHDADDRFAYFVLWTVCGTAARTRQEHRRPRVRKRRPTRRTATRS